jgi:hypothetical protein
MEDTNLNAAFVGLPENGTTSGGQRIRLYKMMLITFCGILVGDNTNKGGEE